jgi:pSer/pThr/pTyr-binding forkhead associated (FHA) protein
MASLYLRITVSDAQGRQYHLAKAETIPGRDPGCDLVIPFIGASRRHAKIVGDGDGFYVEDMHSRCDKRVNGPGPANSIKGRTLLQDGDEIWFGSDVVVQFRT